MLRLVKPQYIIDENGQKVSVIIPISEYERIIELLEEMEDVQLFDEAKNDEQPSMASEEYVKQRRSEKLS
jgi:PHD/YefM family antitoxin component YafN of YafNO toxin-antitoxin module